MPLVWPGGGGSIIIFAAHLSGAPCAILTSGTQALAQVFALAPRQAHETSAPWHPATSGDELIFLVCWPLDTRH